MFKLLAICATVTLTTVLPIEAVASQNEVVIKSLATSNNIFFDKVVVNISNNQDSQLSGMLTTDGSIADFELTTLTGNIDDFIFNASYRSKIHKPRNLQNFPSIQLSERHESFSTVTSRTPLVRSENLVNHSDYSISRNVGVAPEPETYSMMFAGLVLMGFVVKRRMN